MADGSAQAGFGFRELPASRLRPGEIVVDLFAGGGGASEGLKQALGIDPALAYNHDADAIGMHAANHPLTAHHREDIWHADPRVDVAGRAVGWFHASPDCTHFSQAKGGQPRNRKIRALTWVVLKWAGQLSRVGCAPRIISLENVRQILTWGPLVAKRDKATGRALKMGGGVAAAGERVPVELQQLIPDKRHAGRTWRQFVAALEALGYVAEWRVLSAADYGAGTSRERLFLVARRDGEPIRWPEPTHGPGRAHPHVSAAECLDFSIPCPSIFTRAKPLADATLRRIARGVQRHVIDAAEPFFITEFANATNGRTWSGNEPLRTQCAGVKGGHFAAVVPTLVQTGYGEREGQQPRVPDIHAPLGTIVAGGVKHALVSAFLEQANGGGPNGNPAPARSCRQPVSAITASGSQQRLVTAHLTAMAQNVVGNDLREPMPTILAGATRFGVVECTLSPEAEAGALRVAAFLINYYGNGTALGLADPLDTITTRDRMALVTVMIRGTPYVIVDIGLRMLKPHELYRAQGFPPGYIHDRTADGRPLSVSAQVRMVGNSVSPPPLRAIAEANLDRSSQLTPELTRAAKRRRLH